MNIYIGNLSDSALEADLRRTFEGFGRVTKVSIIKDVRTGVSRGYGYVEMPDSNEALTAIRGVHRRDVQGSTLAVGPARWEPAVAETQADFGDFAR
ncbi:MAG TPA: RNA-binding protein [Planctomycetota bacterium]